jgi:hypothetical protein
VILEEAFNKAGVDFYLIGAIAKHYWYSKKDITARITKDNLHTGQSPCREETIFITF